MFLQICDITPELYAAAQSFFTRDFCDALKGKCDYNGSLVGRYIVAQYIAQKEGTCSLNFKKDFTIDGYFYSLSHSRDRIAVIVDTKKVSIDLEFIKERNPVMIGKHHKEIGIIGNISRDHFYSAGDKSRENFYCMRTAKETIVKYLDVGFNAVENIHVTASKHETKNINHIVFDKKIDLLFNEKVYSVISGIAEGYAYAVCC